MFYMNSKTIEYIKSYIVVILFLTLLLLGFILSIERVSPPKGYNSEISSWAEKDYSNPKERDKLLQEATMLINFEKCFKDLGDENMEKAENFEICEKATGYSYRN